MTRTNCFTGEAAHDFGRCRKTIDATGGPRSLPSITVDLKLHTHALLRSVYAASNSRTHVNMLQPVNDGGRLVVGAVLVPIMRVHCEGGCAVGGDDALDRVHLPVRVCARIATIIVCSLAGNALSRRGPCTSLLNHAAVPLFNFLSLDHHTELSWFRSARAFDVMGDAHTPDVLSLSAPSYWPCPLPHAG